MRLLDLFRRRSNSTQNIAAERLRLVLTHDRANISPGMLEVLKDEIIAVISKHLRHRHRTKSSSALPRTTRRHG